MIKVNSWGRLGNNLFQYATGRILADRLGYKLSVKTFPQFKNMIEPVGAEVHFPETRINYQENPRAPGGFCDPEYTMESLVSIAPCKYVFNTFCVKAAVVVPYRKSLCDWLYIENAVCPGPSDLVIHIRLTDFVTLGWALPKDYYLSILEDRKWGKIYICTDDPQHAIVKELKDLGCKVFIGDEFETFCFIKSFDNIAIASTFSWWAAFLSEARRIYMPAASGFWSTGILRVNESRYIYV